MDRRVRLGPLVKWISENNPNGTAKLSLNCGLSQGTIAKVRGGYVPTKPDTRRRLCDALGVSEDEVFPLKNAGKNKAS